MTFMAVICSYNSSYELNFNHEFYVYINILMTTLFSGTCAKLFSYRYFN